MPRLNRFSFAIYVAASAGLLAACEQPVTDPGAPSVASARFDQAPPILDEATQMACDDPGSELVRPRPGVIQCRLLLSPEATAAAILTYDGSIEDLPRLVISLSTQKARTGDVVTGCAFLMIPLKDGSVRRVVHNDRALDARLRRMLAAVGGQPLQTPPEGAAERCLMP